MQHPIDILERYWNYTSFRPIQEDIIQAVLDNEDTFALLPTGGGKSICFQVPALIKEGICIVISPLIALMKDQVNALKNKGIKAMALTSDYSYSDIDIMLDNCIHGNYKFLYLSPERLQQDLVQERIRQMNVNLIAVDEAHCISQWGNDFRPAYKNITLLRTLQPTANVIALTASAKPNVVNDIINELDFISPKIFKKSFKRDNLAYMVFEEEDKYYRIELVLKKNPESSIIYVRNRKNTIQISNHLEKKGITSTFYHGGLSSIEKEKHFSDWMTNRKQVMVATNAFGMGIDKADVKTVIHVNLPESLESYFQEAGRAGRNEKKAYAIILKNKGDETFIKQQFLGILASVSFIKKVYRKLCNYFQISYGEGESTTHEFNFSKFCSTYNFNTLIGYNALQALDRNSVLSLSQEFNKRTTIQILVSNTLVFNYLEKHPEHSLVIKTILRTYGGIFDQETKINTHLISNKSDTPEITINEILKTLDKEGIISLKLKSTDAQITFLQPREDDKTINRITKTIEHQNQLKKQHIASVIEYINNKNTCRSSQLLNYFGETKTVDCGICSVCIHSSKKKSNINTKDTIDKITEILKTQDLSSRALIEQVKINESIVTSALQLMLEKNLIKITPFNTYKLK